MLAWDSNPGRQNGSRKRIQWAMVVPNKIYFLALVVATAWFEPRAFCQLLAIPVAIVRFYLDSFYVAKCMSLIHFKEEIRERELERES